jgi:hypothetical protein
MGEAASVSEPEGVRAPTLREKPPEALLETPAGLTPSVIALSRDDCSPIEGERGAND